MVANNGVEIIIANGVHIIKFVNPNKKNAVTNAAYEIIQKSLQEAATNPDVVLTVFTGSGEYYSSGFDITSSEGVGGDMEKILNERLTELKAFIAAIIDYPKLLIALVNGPAFGIAVTTAALFDIVYASDKATFRTPFTSIGLCAEGCSSYTFPKILGKSKASEMLYLNHQMSAQEAYEFGFVSHVFKHENLNSMWEKIESFAALPVNSIMTSKGLTKKFERKKLHEVNEQEIMQLKERFLSEDFINSLLKFMSRKSKL